MSSHIACVGRFAGSWVAPWRKLLASSVFLLACSFSPFSQAQNWKYDVSDLVTASSHERSQYFVQKGFMQAHTAAEFPEKADRRRRCSCTRTVAAAFTPEI